MDAESRWADLAESKRPTTLRIALLATFTVDPVVAHLGCALEDLGLPAEIFVGPYNQIVQECFSPASETAEWKPQVLVVWPRFEELWGQLPTPAFDPASTYAAPALELADAAYAAATNLGIQLVFVLPAVPEARPLGVGDALTSAGVVATAHAAREQLRAHLLDRRALVFDLEEVVRHVGAAQAYDTRLLAFAHMPFTPAVWSRAGAGIARLLGVSRRAARKVVVVDGDNTLWGGVVGEDGAEHVDLRENGSGKGFLEFQHFLTQLRRLGVLIALASKNDEADVWAVFERREMRLKKADLSAHRVGWQPKSESIKQMAEELGLGLDSFVFIDDNPAELAEVHANLPEVACIRMPADPVEWMTAVQEAGVLDRAPPTADDAQRARFYEQEKLRKEALTPGASHATGSSNAGGHLASLGIAVSIFTPKSADMQRFTQLVNKTNQFNINGLRRTEPELAALVGDGRHQALLVSASDKFGDYGIIGALLIERTERGAVLDTFVLSCRALGRNIEHAFISRAFSTLLGPDEPLFATVLELPRNEPARRFFAELGCPRDQAGVPHSLKRLPWPEHVRLRDDSV